ncbi:hypothetical protein LDO32_00345 [Luteimonas sp. Y-2-2-4F]|nr:hypothetical protein [Luteimonas sp. Y-2-2-4F]MCD9030186.1 hypothetical protein [Luteimonas sp. Y-2-2-4F]
MELSARAAAWLEKNQWQLIEDMEINIHERWGARRKTMNKNGVVQALRHMAGPSFRCMYCGDSEGCDVEHYYPKAQPAWRDRVFEWRNFIWVCAPCNRLKNANFRTDAVGNGILLNPVNDKVWDFFDYVDESGYLVPRFDLTPENADRAFFTSSEKVTRLTHDVVCEGRQRSARGIRRAMQRYESSPRSEGDVEEFLLHVMDAGHPELCEWFFAGQGSRENPYRAFVAHHRGLIDELRQRLNRSYPGIW